MPASSPDKDATPSETDFDDELEYILDDEPEPELDDEPEPIDRLANKWTATDRILDDELIPRMKAGDATAVAEFCEKVYPIIFKVIHRFSFAKDKARDRTHIALMIVLRKFLSFKGLNSRGEKVPVRVWFTSIARNTVKQSAREDGRYVSGYEGDDCVDESDPRADEEREGRINKVQIALGKLRKQCRDILEWRYFEELTYEDISRKIGKSVKVVARRLRTCEQELKDVYLHLSPL